MADLDKDDPNQIYSALKNDGVVSAQLTARNANNVPCIQINIDENYFSFDKQVSLKNRRYFVDAFHGSQLSGSNVASGLLTMERIAKTRPVSRDINREYLSGSNSSEAYKTGIEISSINDFLSGLVKISAGTPGHIVHPLCYGIAENTVQTTLSEILNSDSETMDLVARGAFNEIDLFNPLYFISLQDGEKPIDQLITFPIVTSDNNQVENYILNGIIEPFPIRPVISSFSINFPFEPQGVKGSYGNGNSNIWMANDEVLSVDYYNPSKQNVGYFLDEGEPITLSGDSSSATVGMTIGYFNSNLTKVEPFIDVVQPRGEEKSSTYTSDMSEVVDRMLRQTEVYVNNKQRASTSGIVYDNATKLGTDSIAFGGMTY